MTEFQKNLAKTQLSNCIVAPAHSQPLGYTNHILEDTSSGFLFER